MSACYAPPAGATATAAESPAPASALVAFAGPSPQARLTVAVRIFMVIPQFVVLALLSLAAYVVTVIGWFGALFTGRLPVFAADFRTGYLRWMTRVYAYTFLLTDVYPPFSLDDVDYPVPAPGRVAAGGPPPLLLPEAVPPAVPPGARGLPRPGRGGAGGAEPARGPV